MPGTRIDPRRKSDSGSAEVDGPLNADRTGSQIARAERARLKLRDSCLPADFIDPLQPSSVTAVIGTLIVVAAFLPSEIPRAGRPSCSAIFKRE